MDMDEMEISYDFEDEQYDSRDKQNLTFLQRKRVNPKENLILIHLF